MGGGEEMVGTESKREGGKKPLGGVLSSQLDLEQGWEGGWRIRKIQGKKKKGKGEEMSSLF
jgi:hypothetical protein